MFLVWVLMFATRPTMSATLQRFKHFTEREFSGIFSLAGGILRFQNGNSRWPWSQTWRIRIQKPKPLKCWSTPRVKTRRYGSSIDVGLIYGSKFRVTIKRPFRPTPRRSPQSEWATTCIEGSSGCSGYQQYINKLASCHAHHAEFALISISCIFSGTKPPGEPKAVNMSWSKLAEGCCFVT